MNIKPIYKLRVYLFIIAIYLPLFGYIFNIELVKSSQENRQLAQLPELSFSLKPFLKFLQDYPAYFNDNFGFRNTLIHWHSLSKYYVFQVSPNERVVLGKDNWLFLGDFSNSLTYYRNPQPFTVKELEQYKIGLEKRKNWLAERGIKYIFVIAPNKSSIYPEFMPSGLNQVHSTSRLDQLITYLEKNSDIKILDLRPTLRKHKEKYLVYHRTDTHWNDRGAYLSYVEIIKFVNRWFPNVTPLTMSHFNINQKEIFTDLSNMIGLRYQLQEVVESLTPKYGFVAQKSPTNSLKEHDLRTKTTEVNNKNLPRAVMFVDSFTNGTLLNSLLSENFQYITYFRMDEFDGEIVRQEQPDIVIQQIVERKLVNPFPQDNF